MYHYIQVKVKTTTQQPPTYLPTDPPPAMNGSEGEREKERKRIGNIYGGGIHPPTYLPDLSLGGGRERKMGWIGERGSDPSTYLPTPPTQ